MKRLAALLFGLLAIASAQAEPIQLYGTAGKAAVFLDISRVGDTLTGWYVTLRNGQQMRLEGKLDSKGFFQLEAFAPDTNARAALISGRRKDGHWAGSWKSAAGRTPLALDELRSKLADISGRYRCTGVRKDSEFGITVTETLDLKIAKGRVKSLALSRSQKSDGEEQTCRITPGNMKQLATPVGILLRARADHGSQHCTIRLYRAGDFLVVKPGDSSQSGDDCRGAGTKRFCSADGFWSDLILNRKSQTCRPVR